MTLLNRTLALAGKRNSDDVALSPARRISDIYGPSSLKACLVEPSTEDVKEVKTCKLAVYTMNEKLIFPNGCLLNYKIVLPKHYYSLLE